MVYPRSTYKPRYHREINPVTELTLILLGLSGCDKPGVAKQIQHHLKGVCINDDDIAAEAEQLVPTTECLTLSGKVLGLCVTTVNTPNVTEDEESNRSLGGMIQDFVSTNCVVVMVIQGEDGEEDAGENQMMQLSRFREMVLGEGAESFSLAVYIGNSNAVNRQRTIDEGSEEVNEEEDKDGNEEDNSIPQMQFDVNADKSENDKQVQLLLYHAKMLVKKRQANSQQSESAETHTHGSIISDHGSDRPASVSPQSPYTESGYITQRSTGSDHLSDRPDNEIQLTPLHETNNLGNQTSTNLTDDGDPPNGSPATIQPSEPEGPCLRGLCSNAHIRTITLDDLQPAAIRQLDSCCEVFSDSATASDEREDDDGDMEDYDEDYVPYEEQRSPHHISFVTANPVDAGDLQYYC